MPNLSLQPTGAIALRSTPGLDSTLSFALTACSQRRRLSEIVRHQSQLLGIMKHRMSFLFLSLLLVPSLTTMAATQTTDINTQLKNVADKIRAKTVVWKMPEAELAPELEELDAIYFQHKGENPEDLANVLRFKAMVY